MQPHTLMRPRSREPVTANPGSGPHAYAKLKHSFNFNPRSTNGGKSHPALRIQHPVRSGSGPAGGGGEEFGGAAEDGLSGHFEVVGGPDFAELARPVAHGVDFAFEHDIVDRPAVVGNRDAVGAEERLFAAAHFNIRQMDDPFVASDDCSVNNRIKFGSKISYIERLVFGVVCEENILVQKQPIGGYVKWKCGVLTKML